MIRPEEVRLIQEVGLKDPEWFVQNMLIGNPWAKQTEILNAIRDHHEVAVRSCHSAGKSWIVAQAVIWFLYLHRPSIVITTAPTDRQVRGILWQEIGLAHGRARYPLGGRLLSQELKIRRDWWAWGFTAPDYDPTRFSGFHSKHVLVVIDEACGVSADIFEQIEGIVASGDMTRLVMIGNPTDPDSEFAKRCSATGVKSLKMSAFDTPNFTAFGITKEDIETGDWRDKIEDRPLPYPQLVRPDWVSRQYLRYGWENTRVIARILAEFPRDSEDAFIPLRLIENAQHLDLEPDDSSPNELGVDVARFGNDETVVTHRRGPRLRVVYRGRKQDTMETVGRVINCYGLTGATSIKVDVGGVGAGVYDRLHEQGFPVVAIDFGGSANDPERYPNKRCEMYGVVKEMLENGELDLDEDDEDMASQLSSVRWKPDSRGRPKLEPKLEIRKRGFPSPDVADSAVLSLATGGTGEVEAW